MRRKFIAAAFVRVALTLAVGFCTWGCRRAATGPTLTQPAHPVSFMGVKGHAARVVYVCDRSGYFVNKFDDVRVALRKSIDALSPEQSFDVVFFGERDCSKLSDQLLPVNLETRRRAYDLIDATGSSFAVDGRTEDVLPKIRRIPLESRAAVRAAFAAHPQLIYLMTSEEFAEDQAMRDEVRRLNPDRRVVVNTIACGHQGDPYETVLKQIAAENGGTLTYVNSQALWEMDF